MKYLTTIFTLIMLSSCGQKPEPISYGNDGCHFCRMTIVDQRFGAEVVTEKGKTLKFDAIECMVNHLNQVEGPTDNYMLLVTDFSNPGALIDATQSYYLRSENIPSPMGMYLSAYGQQETAQAQVAAHKGHVYSWSQLVEHFHGLSDSSVNNAN